MKLVGILVGAYLGAQIGSLLGVAGVVVGNATGALDDTNAPGPEMVAGFGIGVVGGALVGGYIGYRVAS